MDLLQITRGVGKTLPVSIACSTVRIKYWVFRLPSVSETRAIDGVSRLAVADDDGVDLFLLDKL